MFNSAVFFFRHPQTRAIGWLFGILSILFSSWVTRLPEIQQNLSLSESELGFSLMGMSIGNLVITPLSAWLLTRTTLGRGNLMSSLFYSFSFLLPVIAYNFSYLLVAMIVVGVFNGYLQFMVNAAAASVEVELKRKIMSSGHGMYSAGMIAGAGSSSLMAGWGVSPEIHLSGLCLLMIAASLWLKPVLMGLPEHPQAAARLRWPGKEVLKLVLLCFGFMFSEGVITDWSALYIKNTLQSNAYMAGLGIAGFSIFMTLGRFAGDGLLSRWPAGRLIIWGGLTGAAGLGIAAMGTGPLVAVIGFSIMGAGYSFIAPLLFSAAYRVPGVHPSSGIAAIATALYLGILVSRPVCGLVAEHFGLTQCILLAALVTLISTLGSRFVKIV